MHSYILIKIEKQITTVKGISNRPHFLGLRISMLKSIPPRQTYQQLPIQSVRNHTLGICLKVGFAEISVVEKINKVNWD